jgi:uncharacterized OB-fold protein
VAGIESVGWALPRTAVKGDEYRKALGTFAARGVQEKTVAAFDEDEVTLAAEAGARALAAASADAGALRGLYFASVGAAAGAAATAALSLGAGAAHAVDFRGAGPPFATALAAACDTTQSTGHPVLVLAADALRGRVDDASEHPLGAGGAAFMVTSAGPLQVAGATFGTSVALDGARVGADGLVRTPTGDDPSGAALRLALMRLGPHGFPLDSFDVLCGPERTGPLVSLHCPEPVAAEALAPAVVARTGDTGAASAAFSLLAALDGVGPGAQVLLADAEGASGAALALKCASVPRGAGTFLAAVAEPRVHLSWHAYLGHRRYLPDPRPTHTVSEGAYISNAQWEESLEVRLQLIASRCADCGAAHHPPRESCPDCGAAATGLFRAAPRGTIYAVTRISRGGAPSEFALHQALTGEYAVVVVDLGGGLRTVAQVTGADPRSVRVGDAVTLHLRRLFEQEGRVRYGLKALPARKD